MPTPTIKLSDYCKGKTYVFIDAANILYAAHKYFDLRKFRENLEYKKSGATLAGAPEV